MSMFSCINCEMTRLPVLCYESYSWSKGIPQGEQFTGMKALTSVQRVQLHVQNKQ